MNPYVLYVFTQDNCEPSAKLKDHVKTLPEAQQRAISWVPLKDAEGKFTALADDLCVELTPTMVIVHENLECTLDRDGDEDCDYVEEPVEMFIGANSIIETLQSNIDAYTYANPPE